MNWFPLTKSDMKLISGRMFWGILPLPKDLIEC